MKKYIGIIDDYGLESFKLERTNNFPFKMRAMLNLHRNARTYEVKMSIKDGELFDKKIRKEQKWKAHARELQKNKTFKWTM